MKASVLLGAAGKTTLQVLWRDAGRAFCRLRRMMPRRTHAFYPHPFGAEHPTLESVNRLARIRTSCFGPHLGNATGGFARERRQTMLVVEYRRHAPRSPRSQPMESDQFLRLATALSSASHLHGRGLIPKDIKPANVLADAATGWSAYGLRHRLRLPREHQSPDSGYRGNARLHGARADGTSESLDRFRNDLSLGVVLRDADGRPSVHGIRPMKWVHCHIARQPVAPGERVSSVPAPSDRDEAAVRRQKGAIRPRRASERSAALPVAMESQDASTISRWARSISDRLMIPEAVGGTVRSTPAHHVRSHRRGRWPSWCCVRLLRHRQVGGRERAP
jgi:serine/threonine protein kinase